MAQTVETPVTGKNGEVNTARGLFSRRTQFASHARGFRGVPELGTSIEAPLPAKTA